MCVFGKVLLSALWWVLGKYWMCVFGDVSLIVLWRYWVSIGCNVLCAIQYSTNLFRITAYINTCIWYGFVECFFGWHWVIIGCVYLARFR
jgi:hypothetical protein